MHVEFTPKDKADFALAMVVEADQPPPLSGRASPMLAWPNCSSTKGATPAGLAAGLQKLLHRLLQDWGGERLSTDATDAARLVDWLAHNQLFAPADDEGSPWQTRGPTLAEPSANDCAARSSPRCTWPWPCSTPRPTTSTC